MSRAALVYCSGFCLSVSLLTFRIYHIAHETFATVEEKFVGEFDLRSCGAIQSAASNIEGSGKILVKKGFYAPTVAANVNDILSDLQRSSEFSLRGRCQTQYLPRWTTRLYDQSKNRNRSETNIFFRLHRGVQ